MYHSLSFEDYCNGMVREENKSDGTVKVSGLSAVHSAMSSRNCYSFSLYHAKNGKYVTDAFCNCADGFETKRIDMGYTAIEDEDALAVLRLADTTGLIKRIEEYKTRNNSCSAGKQPHDKPVRSCLLYYSDGSVKSASFEIDDEIKSAFIKLAEKYTKGKGCTQK